MVSAEKIVVFEAIGHYLPIASPFNKLISILLQHDLQRPGSQAVPETQVQKYLQSCLRGLRDEVRALAVWADIGHAVVASAAAQAVDEGREGL